MALSNSIRTKGPQLKLQDLPEILEMPWPGANNAFNIKSGFEKAGILPLDIEWISKNKTKVKLLGVKTKEQLFEQICEKKLQSMEMEELLKDLDSLNLSIQPKFRSLREIPRI